MYPNQMFEVRTHFCNLFRDHCNDFSLFSKLKITALPTQGTTIEQTSQIKALNAAYLMICNRETVASLLANLKSLFMNRYFLLRN